MTNLSVNLNAVAMLRNRRDIGWPSVTGIARVVLQAGANGITVHPRPDQRHIRDSDVGELATMIRSEFPEAEFNIEGYPDQRFLSLVKEAKPDQVTFVPDDPGQATSDHGWEIKKKSSMLKPVIAEMKSHGFRVVLFVDADEKAPEQAMDVGADRIELYTGPFAAAFGSFEGEKQLALLAGAARAAKKVGMELNAGHDLTLQNIPAFIGALPDVAEVSIGHGITADALLMGFGEAVRRYRALLS